MTALQYHQQLYRRSLFIGALSLILLLAVLALMWVFLADAFLQIPLGLIAWITARVLWFHGNEAWKLSWLIAVDRINANLFRHSKP